MVHLRNLPSGCTLLANELNRARPPFNHGQILVAIRLGNGILIEATWDEHRQQCTVLGTEANDGCKVVVSNRSVVNPNWLPGIVNTMAWSLATGEPPTFGPVTTS